MRGRTVLRGLALATCLVTVPALAGCGSDSGGGGVSKDLEVFSWWTGGGEAAGLEAMVADFKTKNAGVNFINAAVAGGAGSNAKAVLASRLQANDPPDSFQGHAGAELSDYIKANQVEPLNFLYQQEGWTNIFPQQLLDQITVDGNIYSVPVNIHRANVLWYNPSVLRQAGVSTPPTTMAGFLAALEKVKATGRTPLSLGEQWTQKHLLETVMLAELGPAQWAALWKPGGDWSGPAVTRALQTFGRLLSYTNTDAASLTWQDAAKMVLDGKAAFNIMGDWVAGYFTADLKKNPGTDFGYQAVPGTDGVFDWLSDSFTLPRNAKHRDNALAWLREAGSKSGQDAFNPVKGSIPARKDADRSKYNSYLKWSLDQWSADTLAGSLTHGVVANNAWSTDIDTALGLYLQDRNAAKFQSALVAAAAKNAT